MSLNVLAVIERALRLNGALAAGDTPNADDLADSFEAFNTMKRAWFGTLIGARMSPQALTGSSGQAENGGEYSLPASAFTLTAPASPHSGARFGVVDANLCFATHNCTINPNGRLINGSVNNLVLSYNGLGGRWWYRGDIGGWVEEADSASVNSAIEFPDAIIAYMPYMLAVVLAPEFNTELRADVIAANGEGRALMARTYARRGRNAIEQPIGLPAAAPAQGAQG